MKEKSCLINEISSSRIFANVTCKRITDGNFFKLVLSSLAHKTWKSIQLKDYFFNFCD